MAANEINRNYITNHAIFAIDNEFDLTNLPTTSTNGKGELVLSRPCSIGSLAYSLGNKRYFLNGSNNWTEVSYLPELATSSDIENLFAI